MEVRIVNSHLLLLNLRCFPGSHCLEQQFFYIGQNPEVDFRPLILSVFLESWFSFAFVSYLSLSPSLLPFLKHSFSSGISPLVPIMEPSSSG